jgi:hypothetical protein
MARERAGGGDRGVKFTRQSAAEVAELVRAARGGNRGQLPFQLPTAVAVGSVPLTRGTFTDNWPRGGTATVTDSTTPSRTYTVQNDLVSLAASSPVSCVIARIGSQWRLVNWDWTALPNYSNSTQQVLAHNASGQLVWLNTTACP